MSFLKLAPGQTSLSSKDVPDKARRRMPLPQIAASCCLGKTPQHKMAPALPFHVNVGALQNPEQHEPISFLLS